MLHGLLGVDRIHNLLTKRWEGGSLPTYGPCEPGGEHPIVPTSETHTIHCTGTDLLSSPEMVLVLVVNSSFTVVIRYD